MAIRIRNGRVYDPANGLEGEKMDIFVDGGKIVDEIKPDEIIDATDKTVMAGGIDVHSHDRTSPACLSFYPIKSLTYMVI
jgi:formylmethanofuran dehydrogenase subunit A